MKTNTSLIHGYPMIDQHTGASSIPKYQCSTFHQKNIFNSQEHIYSRFSNPTVSALETCIATLEKGKFGFAVSSGMAAISTSLLLLKQGDHLIAPKDIYGGAYQLITDLLPNYGIECTFVDSSDSKNIEKAIKPNTALIYLETPSNPLLRITDISAVVKFANDHNLLTVIDNTFSTPLYQNPLLMGVDIVVHSGTKFINGHSDVVAGFIITNNYELAERIKVHQKTFGNILSVEDSWLVLRGVKTMGLRMEESVNNAFRLATFLDNHPKVKRVFYPGLPTHLNHEIQLSQSKNGGAVLSFELANRDSVRIFSEAIKLPILAVSLGGIESILSYPATMSHACLSEEERLEQGISNSLLRLSCGIEDIHDLLEDFDYALSHCQLTESP